MLESKGVKGRLGKFFKKPISLKINDMEAFEPEHKKWPQFITIYNKINGLS
jgi:hypothetical protein